jgi:hypothetical protein
MSNKYFKIKKIKIGGLLNFSQMLVASLLLLTSCASMYEDYKGRTAVKEDKVREYRPVDSKVFGVEDKNLSITYIPDIIDSGVSFNFKNKTDKALKIIWDETVYMSPSGSSEGVHHAGVTIAERSSQKQPTVIPPKATHNDDIVVNSLVNFTGQYWSHSPMCGVRSLYSHTLDDQGCTNKVFSFYITYEIEGKKNALTVKYEYLGSKPKVQENKN